MTFQRFSHLRALLEFSLRSLPHAYGRDFMQRIVLRHPLCTLGGFLKYCKVQAPGSGAPRSLSCPSKDAFIAMAAQDSKRLLVATGFCQKPLPVVGLSAGDETISYVDPTPENAVQRTTGCPAGRSNHDCLYLARLKLGTENESPCYAACSDCSIHGLGHAALQAGASFAILTSALDIAHDILLPALEEHSFTRVLFAICPYSIEPMSLALLICGLEGYLFTYAEGSCSNYQEWLRADRGDKPLQTALSKAGTRELLLILDGIAAERSRLGRARPSRYQRVGHLFRPL